MNANLKPDQTVGTMRIPDQYRENDSEENKVIYALNQLGEASAEDVGIKYLNWIVLLNQVGSAILRNLYLRPDVKKA